MTAGLTPAQRRVLESAARGDVNQNNGLHKNGAVEERSLEGRWTTVTGIVKKLVEAGLLEIGPYNRWESPVTPTAAGRAELGITETEED